MEHINIEYLLIQNNYNIFFYINNILFYVNILYVNVLIYYSILKLVYINVLYCFSDSYS